MPDTASVTIEPTLEIINGDLPLSDRAIDALADLLIAAGEADENGDGNTNGEN